MEKLELLAQRIDSLIQELDRLRAENHQLREEGNRLREDLELGQMASGNFRSSSTVSAVCATRPATGLTRLSAVSRVLCLLLNLSRTVRAGGRHAQLSS